MKLNTLCHVRDFLSVVSKCSGNVWLESEDGDKINLKSGLSQYVAIAVLINNESENLELFCSHPEDEAKFYNLFYNNPEII